MTLIKVDLVGPLLTCHFDFHKQVIEKFKTLPSAKFVPREKGGPYWTLKADMDTARMLRRTFGDDLRITAAVRDWGRGVNKKHQALRSLASADDAELTVLPEVLPDLYEFISSRPYQRADIKFMATVPSPANANEPGTGKTVELIGAVFEAKMDQGPQLVCAPVTSLESVWEEHLLKWQDHPVITCLGDRSAKLRQLREAQALAEANEPYWLLVNPAMIGYRKIDKKGKSTLDNLRAPFPQLFDIEWSCFIIDEFHKMGLSNTTSLSYKAFTRITAEKRIATSGTPMGGKPIKLFGVLQFLHPEVFTSKWDFAKKWLKTEPNLDQYGNEHGISIEGIRPEVEDEFYEMLSRYLVRRTKKEVTPWLPDKIGPITLWAHMEGEQARQYAEFDKMAEVKIEEEELSATSILAEYTILRQMAAAACEVRWVNAGVDEETGMMKQRMVLYPTEDSCKLPVLMEKLSELGLDPKDMDGKAQVLIFSQFTRMVNMVGAYLKKQGLPVEILTGDTPVQDRTKLIRKFQDEDDDLRILVMNTMAGGTAITLDLADDVIFLDETWVPDDQEQAADRAHRASRIHQVTVTHIRTKDSIEQKIEDVVEARGDANFNILDARRMWKREG